MTVRDLRTSNRKVSYERSIGSQRPAKIRARRAKRFCGARVSGGLALAFGPMVSLSGRVAGFAPTGRSVRRAALYGFDGRAVYRWGQLGRLTF